MRDYIGVLILLLLAFGCAFLFGWGLMVGFPLTPLLTWLFFIAIIIGFGVSERYKRLLLEEEIRRLQLRLHDSGRLIDTTNMCDEGES